MCDGAVQLFSTAVEGFILIPFSTGALFDIFVICRFYTASETHVGIKIVKTLAINLLIFIGTS